MDGWMEDIPFEKNTLLTAGPSEIGNNSWQLYEWKLLMAQGVTAHSPSSSSSGRLGINPKTKTQTWATCIDTFYIWDYLFTNLSRTILTWFVWKTPSTCKERVYMCPATWAMVTHYIWWFDDDDVAVIFGRSFPRPCPAQWHRISTHYIGYPFTSNLPCSKGWIAPCSNRHPAPHYSSFTEILCCKHQVRS